MIPAHRDPYPRALAMVYHPGADGPHVADADVPLVGVFLNDKSGDDESRARHYFLTPREADRLARDLTHAANRLADEITAVRDGVATLCGECMRRADPGMLARTLAPRASRYRVVDCGRHGDAVRGVPSC